MTIKPLDSSEERRELQSRVRIGVTGLAFVFVLTLLIASFAGTASNEPPLTSDVSAEGGEASVAVSGEEAPQEPLAELGVAPGAAVEEEPDNAVADETGVVESLEELDSRGRP